MHWLHTIHTHLHNILFKTIPKADSYIKNGFQLIDKLKRLYITGEYKLISLNVISLFTNVPIDIVVDCVNEQWNFISKECSLPKNEFLGAIRFVLDSTFFSFDNKIYKQSFGTLMGSPLLPVIADLVMRRLKTVSLISLNLDTLFYYRYVDDICTAVSPSKIEILLQQFNSFHPRLQFTTEIRETK